MFQINKRLVKLRSHRKCQNISPKTRMMKQYVSNLGGKAKGLELLIKTEEQLYGKSTVPKALYIPVTKLDTSANFYNSLGTNFGKYYAVRSSASVEDNSQKSYAGHFKTELGVDYNDLYEKALKVANSYGEHKENSSVIVQEFINSKKSGVIFCYGGLDVIVINSNFGLCETVVSGKSCDTYYVTYNQKTGKLLNIYDKIESKQPLVFDPKNKKFITEQPINDGSLSNEEIKKLVEHVLKIRNHVNFNADIEFCFDDEMNIRLLQLRPITAPLVHSVILYDGANIQESYSGLTLPLTISIVKYGYSKLYMDALVKAGVDRQELKKNKQVFDDLLVDFYGQVYYNLDNWKSMLGSIPIKQDDSFEKMITSEVSGYNYQNLTKIQGPSYLKYMIKAIYGYLNLGKDIKSLLNKGDDVFKLTTAEYVNKLSYHETILLINKMINDILSNWNVVGINDFFISKLYNRFASRYSKNELMKLIKFDTISTQQIYSLDKLSKEMLKNTKLWECIETNNYENFCQELEYDVELKKLYDAYMLKFKSRTPGELKLETINIHDDFEKFSILIKNYANQTINKGNDVIVNKLDFVDKIFLRLFKWHAINREDLRLLRSQFFDVMRNLVIRIGKILENDGVIENYRDIMYVTFNEIIDIDKYKSSLRGNISKRKNEYITYSDYELPKYFWSINGHIPLNLKRKISINEKPDFVIGRRVAPSNVTNNDIITGEVILIIDPSEITNLLTNNKMNLSTKILVAKNTDPGYTPIIHLVKGVIVEEGGDISHAAIVTREINKPCIIGIPNMTNYVTSGLPVTMELFSGKIKLNS